MDCKIHSKAGQALFRVVKSDSQLAKTYPVYGQSELRKDLGIQENTAGPSLISTDQTVPVLQGGELVVSLINPTMAIVGKEHAGYVLSQNFLQVFPGKDLDPKFLMFLFNESKSIRSQIKNSIQVSTAIEKLPKKAFDSLILPSLPDLEQQKLLGRKYECERELLKLRKKRDELIYKKTVEEMRRWADDAV